MINDPPCAYLDYFGLPTGFVVGLDLGQARDFSALIINEKRVDKLGNLLHAIRFAHRFRLGLSYLDVAREVRDLIDSLPDCPDLPALYADSTGVGRPVTDMLRDQGLDPWNVTLTAGANWSINPGRAISLPKTLMASMLNVAFQSGEIGIAADLPWRDQLVRELDTYRVTTSAAGHDSFNSRTEADHDDLVVALGLAVFGATLNWRPPRTHIL